MLINDRTAFLKHKQRITLELINGERINVCLDLNMRTANYYQMICMVDSLQTTTNDKEKIYLLAEITNEILDNSDLDTNTEWIINNITSDSQVGLLNYASEYINKMLDDDCFRMPDIKIKKNSNNSNNNVAKERENKKAEIQRLENVLKNKQDIELMNEIAFVVKETSNTFWDIMCMPILTFRCLVRALSVMMMRSDDDYNIAYLNKQISKETEKLNNDNKVINQPHKDGGANLKILKTLLNK